MHADHTILEIIAHGCIAFLFLFRGITALPDFQMHVTQMRDHHLPFPTFVAAAGITTMFVGGFMVAFDVYTTIGAGLLILFTVMANLLYHDFWKMTEPRPRETHIWIFCNNIAVTGGLLMVAVP